MGSLSSQAHSDLAFVAVSGVAGAALAASYHGVGASVAHARGFPVVWPTVGKLATRAAFKVGFAGATFALSKCLLRTMLPERRTMCTVLAGGAAFAAGGVADRAGMALTMKKFGYGRAQFLAAMFASGTIFLGGTAAMAERLVLGPVRTAPRAAESDNGSGDCGGSGGSFFAASQKTKSTWQDVWHPGLNRTGDGHEKDKAWRRNSAHAAVPAAAQESGQQQQQQH